MAPLVLSLGTSILSSQVTARKFGGTQGVIPSLTKLSFNRNFKMVSPASHASGKGAGHFLEFRGTPFHTISESLRENCLTAISLFIDCIVLYCGCWSRSIWKGSPLTFAVLMADCVGVAAEGLLATSLSPLLCHVAPGMVVWCVLDLTCQCET